MSEYIDRNRAISEAKYEFGNVGAKVMSRIPASKVAPVVRCKECIHHGSRLDKDGVVHIACYKMNDDDFCSYGERYHMKG